MGLSKEVWWYVILQEQGGEVHGLMNKEVFVKLLFIKHYMLNPGNAQVTSQNTKLGRSNLNPQN